MLLKDVMCACDDIAQELNLFCVAVAAAGFWSREARNDAEIFGLVEVWAHEGVGIWGPEPRGKKGPRPWRPRSGFLGEFPTNCWAGRKTSMATQQLYPRHCGKDCSRNAGRLAARVPAIVRCSKEHDVGFWKCCPAIMIMFSNSNLYNSSRPHIRGCRLTGSASFSRCWRLCLEKRVKTWTLLNLSTGWF